jgi:hypothetical protein
MALFPRSSKPELPAATSGFLGMRATSVDVDLHPSFVALVEAVARVADAYRDRQLSGADAAATLTRLVVQDISGTEWTVGTLSGRWHRRLNDNLPWEPTMPPVAVVPVAGTATSFDLPELDTAAAPSVLPAALQPRTEADLAGDPANDFAPADRVGPSSTPLPDGWEPAERDQSIDEQLRRLLGDQPGSYGDI